MSPTRRARRVWRARVLCATLGLALLWSGLGSVPASAQTTAVVGQAASAAAAREGRWPTDEDGLSEVLAGVAQHPGLRAAAAVAEAAALRVGAVRSPIAFNLDMRIQRLRVDPATDPLPPPFDELFAVDEASDSASLTALLRPFVAGDLRDLLDQRLLDLERSQLALREARAGLEAQALRAAAGVLLAERGLALARDGAAIAERALAATRTRHAAGAAAELELRRSELQLSDARRSVERAERQLATAAAGLRQLVGDARLRDVPQLAPVLGAPPDLIRAVLDVALAEVGWRNQSRALLPTVQAGYTWLRDEGDSLTVALESRTLQPSITYATGAAPGAGFGVPGPGTGIDLEGALPTVRASLTVGISWSISPQSALETEASSRQLEAAAAALAAAHDRAEVQRRIEHDAYASALAALELAALELELVGDEAAAAVARFEAGVIGALERDAAVLAQAQAEFAWLAARVDLLAAVLDTHVTYAIPISEVRP